MNEKEIDYLQFSMEVDTQNLDPKAKNITPTRFYTRGIELDNGTRIYMGNVKTKKALYILSGETLRNMRFSGRDISEYIQKMLSKGAIFSRVDMCVTQYVVDDIITPSDYADYHRNGLVESSHAKYGAKYIASVEKRENVVETLYIGDMKNRGKRGIVRAYDKGIELGLSPNIISRLEVEDKRDKAQVSAKRLADGYTIAEVLKTRFNVNDDRFQALIEADSIKTTRGTATVSEEEIGNDSRWQWLINSVAPALAKALYGDAKIGRSDRKELFDKELMKHLNRLYYSD